MAEINIAYKSCDGIYSFRSFLHKQNVCDKILNREKFSKCRMKGERHGKFNY